MKAIGRVPKFPSQFATSAILLIGCAISVNSIAANNMHTECDEISPPMLDLDAPITALIAAKTDHVLVPTAVDAEDLAGQPDLDPQSIAPILSLTPRVANILDRVFASDSATPDSLDAAKTETASPVADSDDNKVNVEDSPLLQPQLQNQMYRKDI